MGRVRCLQLLVGFYYPQQGYVKLNCDGASNNLGMAGIRGIIRGDQVEFYACYAKHVFKNDNNVAEVWVIRNGILLAKDMGFKKIEVESDSTYAIQLCKKEVQVPWNLHSLIEDIDALKKNFDAIGFHKGIERPTMWLIF
ncbi:uncharacterized protein LOC113293952 [Papaver somniferum]|uniref:uncharacterized protein LOC113293952 n=1 Tax=Papaver somniferum TaxID=3469 RepID=UPI000E6FA729|nr:uncharacterized protein LOC113293952 [Papaver somniferum]